MGAGVCGDQRLVLTFFLQALSTLYFEIGSLTEPGFSLSVKPWPVSPQDLSVFVLQCWCDRQMHTLGFLCECWGSELKVLMLVQQAPRHHLPSPMNRMEAGRAR